MIASMTAFGREELARDWGTATWEVRSVNHRYLEMNIRLPEDLRMLEPGVRERIARHVARGKVDCTLRFEPRQGDEESLHLNTELIDRLLGAAESLSTSATAPFSPFDILRWPGVLEKQVCDLDMVSRDLMELLDSTLGALVETRRREGAKLRQIVAERCNAAATVVSGVKSQLPAILNTLRDRYRQKALELQVELDRERLEQELLMLGQKMDVTEELDRMSAHLEEILRTMDQPRPVGRRLDFLMQEMNREANTLGSKAAGLDMSNASVELKVLIEQMREQIQNLE